MRVAVVAEWYPSPADPVHGVWAHHQAVASVAAGAEIQVLALRRPVPPMSVGRRLARVPPDVLALGRWASGMRRTLAPWSLDGLPIHSVPWIGPPRPLSYGTWGWWMSPSLGAALDRMYAAWPFDVLHAHTLAPAGHAAARWIGGRSGATGFGSPAFVVSAHGGDMIRVPDSGAPGRRAVLTALERADLLIANSTWAQRRCEAIAGRPLASTVVHLGASVASGVGGGAVSGGGRLRLITIAHLQQRKHHHVVLRAIAGIAAERRPDYLIVGDGEMREPLEALVDELGLRARVAFAGQLDNAEAVALLPDRDLFVMPGVEEPFGVAFVEAMAAGVPAVGSRGEGGPQDIAAAGEGMLLVGADDVAGLSGLIGRLDADREELARLSAAARATAHENFTWERCGTATVAAYEDALARHRSGGLSGTGGR